MKKILLMALIGGLMLGVSQVHAGSLFITGHDSDDHSNTTYGSSAQGAEYINVALDWVGASANVAYIYNTAKALGMAVKINAELTGYTLDAVLIGSSQFNAILAGTTTYDTILIGSGYDAINSSGSANLNSYSGQIQTFFNDDNNIVALSEQSIGQSFYNFMPEFGTTISNTISDLSAFSPTAEGLAIGLTDTIVDGDITHTSFADVNTAFTIFETYNVDGSAVAMGFEGTFSGGCPPSDPSCGAAMPPVFVPVAPPVPGPAPVPEPSTVLLLGVGLLGLASYRRRKKG